MADNHESSLLGSAASKIDAVVDYGKAHYAEELMVAGGVALVVLSRGKLSAAADRILPEASGLLRDINLLKPLSKGATELASASELPASRLFTLPNPAEIAKRDVTAIRQSKTAALNPFPPSLLSHDGSVAKTFYDHMSTTAWKDSLEIPTDVNTKLKVVQTVGNKLADAHNLPRPKFHLINEGATSGVYLFGTTKIGISESRLATDAIAEIAGTAGHEMTHLEQAKLIICNLADSAKIGKVAPPQQIQKLNEAFEKEFGFSAQPSFLKQVLEKREGVRLSTEERIRAQMLHSSVVKDGPRKVTQFEVETQTNVLDQLFMDVTSGSESTMMGALKKLREGERSYSPESLTLSKNPYLGKIVRSLQVDASGEFVPLNEDEAWKLEGQIADFASRRLASLDAKSLDLEIGYYDAPHEEEARLVGDQIKEHVLRWTQC